MLVSTFVTVFGIVISASRLHALKLLFAIVVKFFGNLTFSNALHSANALLSIEVTVSGMLTSFTLFAPFKI